MCTWKAIAVAKCAQPSSAVSCFNIIKKSISDCNFYPANNFYRLKFALICFRRLMVSDFIYINNFFFRPSKSPKQTEIIFSSFCVVVLIWFMEFKENYMKYT